ncbi:hypothetical protein LMG1860_01757 [Achromobacter denitrificans]|nr:hypothetical protein LMG1860_01757 [Achromobacter denitrificans]
MGRAAARQRPASVYPQVQSEYFVQIVIPMSGFGERFRRAGYSLPKPLISIEGKPIVAHVIDMFPGEKDFLFICNQEHLDNPDYAMEATLKHYCPTARIVGIPSHKLGPIYAVRQVEHLIKEDVPVVVNYCDFTCYWDWSHFLQFASETGSAGIIPAYRGFHPHTLGSTNYAYMREKNGWVLDIQEKQPYTADRMNEYASSGTYYFHSGALMKQAFKETMDAKLEVNGEFYVSLAYKPLLARSLPIAVYPLQHFMQWGTPQDVAEYNNWSAAFRTLVASESETMNPIGSVVMPMAGMGKRFADEGYVETKPLIPVSGKAMVLQAANDLPPSVNQVFVLRRDMPGHSGITEELLAEYPGAIICTLDGLTEGQACTAQIGVNALQEIVADLKGPITIAACDNGMLYDTRALKQCLEDDQVDVIVWAARGHANAVRHPQMFGWIDELDGHIRAISVKQPLDSPDRDPIVIGNFTFRRAEDFQAVVTSLQARNGRINGEFYLDSAINDAIELGLNCRIFVVDNLLSWGTPNDLRTFEYWQSCFHKWLSHPYRLENDRRVARSQVAVLDDRYRKEAPALPGQNP